MLKATVTITLSLLVALVASIPIADRAEKRTPTLLVSLDGLQATKLDEFLRNNPDSYMNRFFVDRGVKADYMAASFPTLTFPNHFTLVTGLYQESHGIVGNTLFDPKIDKRVNFLSDNYANDEMWWDQAEPIWLSAKRQGLKTASFFWTGSEVWRRHPDVFLSYSSTLNFLDRCEEVVGWFQKFEMDFVTLYFNQPDSTGHDFGPNSKEYMQKIGEVDEVIGYLLTLLIRADLLDKVNVLIVSDHGMAEMTSTIVISNLLSTSLLNTTKSVYGIVGSIWPRTDAQKQEVFDALSKSPLLKVYFKEDMPPEYNFKNNDRIGPIVTIADEGYILSTGTNVLKGNHGFDNRYESMRAVFMAHGPDFKRNVKIGPVANVDVYPLLCEIVNVRCNPNNGTIMAFSQGLAFTPKNLSYN